MSQKQKKNSKVAGATDASEKAGTSAKGKDASKSKSAQVAEARAERAAKKARKDGAKKTLSKTAKYVLVAIGCAAMLLSVSAMACSGVLNQASSSKSYKLTGGVAATVNGVNITEDTITKQIMSVRTRGGYTKDKDWAQYLVDQNTTPEKLRKSYIESYAKQYLSEQAVKEYNITVSDADVQKAYDDAVAQYGGKDSFERIIKAMGYTEDTYKPLLKSRLEQNKLKEKVAPAKDATDQEILDYFNQNFDTYNDARRSENLLIKVDSKATDEEKAKAKEKAQEILDKINAGEISFEDAVAKYSEDTGSKDDKGDVGWDKLTRFVTEYQSALNGLSKDQISGVVETNYGYHLIKCTDVFKLDGNATSIDQLPDKFKDYIGNVVKTQTQSAAYSKWETEYFDKADIKINDMPENVPYNVSLDGVTPTSEKGSAATTSGSNE